LGNPRPNTMVGGKAMIRIRHGYIGAILSKPFEWIMRLSYEIHLYFDGNSSWYCLTQDELNEICKEAIKEPYLFNDNIENNIKEMEKQ